MKTLISTIVLALSFTAGSAWAQKEVIDIPFCPNKKGEPGVFVLPETDWMFFDDELQASPHVANVEEVAAFARLVEVFKDEGSKLVMSVLPPRPLTVRDLKGRSVTANDQAFKIEDLRKAFKHHQKLMKQSGAVMVNLGDLAWGTGGMNDDYYYKQDHHWTPAGRDASIAAMAAALKANGHSFPAPANLSYAAGPTRMLERPGSRAEKADKYCPEATNPEVLEEATVEVRAADLASALFGDPAPAASEQTQIPLLGTSNMVKFDGALHLSKALNTQIDDWSIVGGGATTAIESYLLNRAKDANAPSHIIWEVSASAEEFIWRSAAQILGAHRQGCPSNWTMEQHNVEVKRGEWKVIRLDGRPLNQFGFIFEDLNIDQMQVALEQKGKTSKYLMLRPEQRLQADRKGMPWYLSTEVSKVQNPSKIRIRFPKHDGVVHVYGCAL